MGLVYTLLDINFLCVDKGLNDYLLQPLISSVFMDTEYYLWQFPKVWIQSHDLLRDFLPTIISLYFHFMFCKILHAGLFNLRLRWDFELNMQGIFLICKPRRWGWSHFFMPCILNETCKCCSVTLEKWCFSLCNHRGNG